MAPRGGVSSPCQKCPNEKSAFWENRVQHKRPFKRPEIALEIWASAIHTVSFIPDPLQESPQICHLAGGKRPAISRSQSPVWLPREITPQFISHQMYLKAGSRLKKLHPTDLIPPHAPGQAVSRTAGGSPRTSKKWCQGSLSLSASELQRHQLEPPELRAFTTEFLWVKGDHGCDSVSKCLSFPSITPRERSRVTSRKCSVVFAGKAGLARSLKSVFS